MHPAELLADGQVGNDRRGVGEHNLGIHEGVRDVLGGALMANNNRFYVDNAQLLLMVKSV